MDNRSRRVLYLIGGGYLVYLGINLISGQMEQATSNAPIALICAALFILFGAYLVIDFIRKSIKDFNEENNVEQMEEKEEE